MKITIITGPFGCIPPYALGAVEKIWYGLGNQFRKEGHNIHFISKMPPINIKSNSQNTYIKGYARTGSFKKDLILDFIYSFKALYALEKTDVLVLNSICSPILCKLFKHKYKITVYNVARFPKKQFKLYSNIDRLACVSTPVMKELLLQTPNAVRQAVVIANPIDTEIFHYKEKIEDNNITVCYAGRVHPEKGIEILVSAFSILQTKYPNILLSIIGPRSIANGGGGSQYINKLNKITNNINWIDPIKDSQSLSQEISKSDIFCYPSIAEYGETFGVSPLEAMAIGIPTIVSDLDCFKDFIKDGENGLVFNHRSKDAVNLLVNKIKLLVEDKKFRRKLSYNGAMTAKKAFNIEHIANQYLNDFERTIAYKNGKTISQK